jgi:hypothetical protein
MLPNKDNAINLINYLQSPTNQFIKINPDVWGDFYAIDISRLNEIDKMKIDELQQDKINLQVNKFMEFRLPDMNIEYHSFVNELWEVSINGN